MGTSSTGIDPLTRLSRVITLLAASGDPDAIWVAEGLTSWRDDGQPIEAVLGLPPAWRSDDRRQRQNQGLTAVAAYFPGLCGRELARRMTAAERRYRTSWPRDRNAGHRPDGLNGAVFDVLSLGEFPSEEKLRKLFNGVIG
jgi:hypothetical protein